MTDIDNSKKRDVGKNGISIKIIGGARFSSIAGKKIYFCINTATLGVPMEDRWMGGGGSAATPEVQTKRGLATGPFFGAGTKKSVALQAERVPSPDVTPISGRSGADVVASLVGLASPMVAPVPSVGQAGAEAEEAPLGGCRADDGGGDPAVYIGADRAAAHSHWGMAPPPCLPAPPCSAAPPCPAPCCPGRRHRHPTAPPAPGPGHPATATPCAPTTATPPPATPRAPSPWPLEEEGGGAGHRRSPTPPLASTRRRCPAPAAPPTHTYRPTTAHPATSHPATATPRGPSPQPPKEEGGGAGHRRSPTPPLTSTRLRCPASAALPAHARRPARPKEEENLRAIRWPPEKEEDPAPPANLVHTVRRACPHSEQKVGERAEEEKGNRRRGGREERRRRCPAPAP
ncbi:uncharacterized protein [Miscanthus floridulus]|uniref:uncharacterized protein n=1 Tax=Miscanthus floridulus TaxID=154761 RepID=UPI0034585FE8